MPVKSMLLSLKFSLSSLAYILAGSLGAQVSPDCFYPGASERWTANTHMAGSDLPISATAFSADGATLFAAGIDAVFAGDDRLKHVVSNTEAGQVKSWIDSIVCEGCTAEITALQPIGDEGLVIAGRFTSVTDLQGNTLDAPSLVFIRFSDSLAVVPSGGLTLAGGTCDVLALAYNPAQNRVFVGGKFNETAPDETPVALQNLAHFDFVDGLPGPFAGDYGGVTFGPEPDESAVQALFLTSDDELVVGGRFTLCGPQGLPCNAIAALNPQQPSADWDNLAGGLLLDDAEPATVHDLDGNYCVGNFGSPGAYGVAVRSGNAFLPLAAPANFDDASAATTVAAGLGDTLYVGGQFFFDDSSPAALLQIVVGTGTWSVNQVLTPIADSVLSLSSNGPAICAAGNLANFDGLQANNIFVRGSSFDQAPTAGLGLMRTTDSVNDLIELEDGLQIWAGSFVAIAGDTVNSVVYKSASGQNLPLDLNVFAEATGNTPGIVNRLLLDGDWLYLAGDFERVNGTACGNIARYNLQSGALETLDGGVNPVGFIRDMAFWQGDLVVSGRFSGAGSNFFASQVAVFNGSSWQALSFPFNGGQVINSVTPLGDSLIIGGDFNLVIQDNISISDVALYNGSEWEGLGRGVAVGEVFATAYDSTSQRIYIGGDFTSLRQSDNSTFLARDFAWFENGLWNKQDDVEGDGIRKLLVLNDGVVYLGGSAFAAGDYSFNGVARFSAVAGWMGLGAGVTAGGQQVAGLFAGPSGDLWASGNFARAGLIQSGGVARYTLEEDVLAEALPSVDFTIEYTGETSAQFSAPNSEDTTWEWSFGDGNSASGQTVEHTYDETGAYWVVLTATNACGSRTDSLLALVGVESLSEMNLRPLRVAPNPTSGQVELLNVANAASTVQIIGLDGKHIANMTLLAGTNRLDMSALAQGTYLVVVQQGDLVYRTRVSVLR